MKSLSELFLIIKKKVFSSTGKNISWLTGDKLARLAIGTVIGAFTARYLRPEGFGVLSFFLAYSGVFSPIASFGINSILARDLPQQREKQGSIVLSSVIIKGIALIISIAAGLFWGLSSKQLDGSTYLLFLLASVGTFGFLFEGFDVYHQTRQDAKTVVKHRFSAFLITSIFRAIGVIYKFPISYFVFFMAFDFLIGSVSLFIATLRSGLVLPIRHPDWKQIASYIKEGSIITLGVILTAIYMRADKLIIQQLFGNASLGVYAAATKLSELWLFVPTSIAAVYAPLLAARKANPDEYKRTLLKQMAIAIYASYAIALLTTVFSPLLIKILYGNEYIGAVTPLRYHIWSLVFATLGTAQAAWNAIERKQLQFLIRSIIGTIAGMSLYYLLIPRYGLIGGAIATTISYAVPNLLSNYFHKSTREFFWMQLKVLVPSWGNIKMIFS